MKAKQFSASTKAKYFCAPPLSPSNAVMVPAFMHIICVCALWKKWIFFVVL